MPTLSTLSFPAIRGIQAGREYYVSMWTLRMMRQVSVFDEKELPPEMRAQRQLNKTRVPEMRDYILDNPDDYVFSALTVSIDSDVEFEPMEGSDNQLGILRVPMEAKFVINDGQHRRAAILEALDQKPALAYETIAVVFFLDHGLARSQQMFIDLNRCAIRSSRSISILYDHRDDQARLARLVIAKSEIFRDIVDMEKSSLAPRSRKLFTLSAFYNACADLVADLAVGDLEQDAALARDFWEAVARQFPAWTQVRDGKLASSAVREEFIHSHGVTLQALGKAGNALLKAEPKAWKARLKPLKDLNWSRANSQVWEGRTMLSGRVQKSHYHLTLTANVIKRQLGLTLSEEEALAESEFCNNGRIPASV